MSPKKRSACQAGTVAKQQRSDRLSRGVKKECREDEEPDCVDPQEDLYAAMAPDDLPRADEWGLAERGVEDMGEIKDEAARGSREGLQDGAEDQAVQEEEEHITEDSDISGSRLTGSSSSAARLSACSPPRLSSTRTSGSELQLMRQAVTAAYPCHEADPQREKNAEDLSPHTRLVIRDIEVENFKSYYGMHRIGPFHKTFTAVIGPNGSGKSNVIDSMLFVFGRNAKKIRLDKLAGVIHNSAAHPNVSYASVTVNFIRILETAAEEKDSEQRQEVAGSVLRIKREVFRSGASQYYIDGVRRTQKEVMECLIAQGVDLEHNRFLILQGEVEQIALMKPKAEKEGEEGLLEYLDDLIGTSEYMGRISHMTAAAETAQLARLEALDRERKLRAEREALDDAKNSTLSFVTKDNQLQKTLIVMCQLRMRGIEEKLEEPRRLLSEIDARITVMEEEVLQRREDKARAEEAFVAAKKHVAEVQRARDAVRTRRQSAEALLEQVKSGADQEEKARKKVADQLRKAKEELQRAVLHQQDAEREAAIHQQNYNEAIEAVSALQLEHDKLSEALLPKLRPLRQQLEENRKKLAPFERGVIEAKEQRRTAQSRLNGLADSARKKQQQLADLEASTKRDEARVAELERLLQEADRKDVQEEVLRVQDQIGESARRKYAINNSIQELKSAYRDGEADDRAMEFLLAQRSLKGYYGTLRQLGRIGDQYDIAAGVASNAWGFHVVEDRQTATAALELLKQNNIGRATMMVVSEVEREVGPRMAKPFQSPNPKARRLFDLIQPTNPKFRSVFFQAVRDTVVVETLAEARETAFGGAGGRGRDRMMTGGPSSSATAGANQQRFRVVTVKGELVEPSGAITGGGAAPRGAKLKAARSPQDKQTIKEELQRLQQDLVRAAEEERALNVRLHQLHEQESHLHPEQLRKLRHELTSLVAKVDGNGVRLASLRTELTESTKELELKRAQYEQDLDDCERAVEKAEKGYIAHHAGVEALESQVDEAGGASFKKVAASLATQQERTDAEEASLRACRREIQKHRATQERKSADIADYERQLKKLEEEVQDNVKEKVRECVEVLEGLVKELNGAEAQLAKAQAAADDSRAAVPVVNGAALNAQKKLDDEQRYRQTEAAKIADALQELSKFEQKIEGCEQKIRDNAELYGRETLGESDGDIEDDGDVEMEDGDEDEDEDSGDEAAPGRKRPRACVERGREEAALQRPSSRGSSALTSAKRARVDLSQRTFRLSPEDLNACDYDRSVQLAKALSEETKRLHSEIDFRAVALWRERDVAHREAKATYEAKKAIHDKAEHELQTLKDTRRKAFMDTFEHIRLRLKEVYQLLTHGGDADMELVDVNDPFEGVNFVVRPPKKSWKQISNLSGGEKTLSSLALIFSLHYIKPTPIYVMDEIDAALDFRNVSIVANYVLRQARGAQFIIISLRNNMFEEAHQLVGVCKVNDTTSTLVLMPRGFRGLVATQLAEAAALQQQRRLRDRRRSCHQLVEQGAEEKSGNGDVDSDARGSRNSLVH